MSNLYIQCHQKITGHPYLPPMLTYSWLLSKSYFEILDEPENADVCKRMVMHDCMLFETQLSEYLLNVTCGKSWAICLSLQFFF